MTDDEVLDGLGGLERAASEAAKAMSQRLAELTEWTASVPEAQLRERLYSLENFSLGEQRAEVFESLCRQINEAFGDQPPTNAQVLANSATPDLVRYLLRALSTYRDRAASAHPGRALAQAMMASNPQSRPRFKGREVEIVEAAQSAKSGSAAQATQAAMDAAYKVFRRGSPEEKGETGGQSSTAFKATAKDLHELLVREGVIPAGSVVAPNRDG